MSVYHPSKNLPPAISDFDFSCCKQRFFEIHDQDALDVFARRVLSHFRRSSNYELDGQVKFDV